MTGPTHGKRPAKPILKEFGVMMEAEPDYAARICEWVAFARAAGYARAVSRGFPPG
jgi:hypothetical protein